MTKSEFKARWESTEDGGGITMDEVAQCASSWGLLSRPKCCSMGLVLDMVLGAAGIHSQQLS
jgi:hypothetical protein